MKGIVFFMFMTQILVVNAYADSLDEKVCKSVLSSGIRSTYSVFSDQEKYDQYQSRLCDVSFESYDSFSSTVKARGLNIEYAESLLEFKGDSDQKRSQFSQKYSKFCSSDFQESEYRHRFVSQSSKIETALASSFNNCVKNYLDVYLKTQQQGLFIYVTPQRDFKTFNVRVERNRNVVPEEVIISNFMPDEEVLCTRNGNEMSAGDEIKLNNFSMTCRKDPDSPISFAIETKGEGVSNEVFLPARKDTINELEEKVEQLTILISDLAPLNRVVAFAAKECPAGWKEYGPSYGRFIRGIDRSGQNIDPEGERPFGHLQNENVGAHSHGYKGGGAAGTTSADKGGDRQGLWHDGDPGQGGDRVTHGNTDGEVHPDNVALLYCIKN